MYKCCVLISKLEVTLFLQHRIYLLTFLLLYLYLCRCFPPLCLLCLVVNSSHACWSGHEGGGLSKDHYWVCHFVLFNKTYRDDSMRQITEA